MVNEWVVGTCSGRFALGSGNRHGLRIGRHDQRKSEAGGAMFVQVRDMVYRAAAIGSRVCSPRLGVAVVEV